MSGESSRKLPLGLKNLGQNVCFFNSVIQALYSVDDLRKLVFQFNVNKNDSPAKFAMKELFTSMTLSDIPIETYHLIPSFNLLDYNHARFEQFDAQEFLIRVLDQILPIKEDESIFTTSVFESVLCKQCKKVSERTIYEPVCQIKFAQPFNNSIENLISKLVNDPYGEPLDELYHCSNCPVRTNAIKSRTLFHISDYLIVSLGMFSYDRINLTSRKLVPDVKIEAEFENVLLGTVSLQAIVFHHGDAANSGHYTSAVKYGQIWYSINDDKVSRIDNPDFNCRVKDDIVPYLLIYKKSNKQAISHQSIPNLNAPTTQPKGNHNIPETHIMEHESTSETRKRKKSMRPKTNRKKKSSACTQ